MVNTDVNAQRQRVRSSQLAAPNATYISVEADPLTADSLENNIAANSIGNVTVVRGAVVSTDAPPVMDLLLLDLEPSVPTGAYLSAGTEGIKNRPAARAVRVDTVPVTELVGDSDLIKLDIEGYEAKALESGWSFVLDTRLTIVVEVRRDVPHSWNFIRELLAADYAVLAVDADRLHQLSDAEVESSGPLPRFGSRDAVLMARERTAEWQSS
ncbi:MAG: FkbM family methyltransferase [Candidatus Azotimanducaceae bacterium]|jgi:FkbM family methyltransferase